MLALLAALALLAPSVAPIAGPDALAWLPAHGHLFLGGAPHEHAHPWDHAPAAHPASSVSDAGIVFTAGGDAGASDTASVFALPASALLLLAVAWLTRAIAAPRVAWSGRLPSPPVPPPQG